MPGNDPANSLLAIHLDAAVPLCMYRVSKWSFERRKQEAERVLNIVASEGDTILYLVKGKTAQSFNALAEGIAILATVPGGVTVFGRHWCTDHNVCKNAAVEEPGDFTSFVKALRDLCDRLIE